MPNNNSIWFGHLNKNWFSCNILWLQTSDIKGAENTNLFKCQKNNIESPSQNLLSWFISCALCTVREICFYVLSQEFWDEIINYVNQQNGRMLWITSCHFVHLSCGFIGGEDFCLIGLRCNSLLSVPASCNSTWLVALKVTW